MSRRFTLLALGCSLLISPSAQASLSPCSKAIGGAIEKYPLGKREAIASCEDRRTKRSLASNVHCRPPQVAVSDPKSHGKLMQPAAKVGSSTGHECTVRQPLL